MLAAVGLLYLKLWLLNEAERRITDSVSKMLAEVVIFLANSFYMLVFYLLFIAHFLLLSSALCRAPEIYDLRFIYVGLDATGNW